MSYFPVEIQIDGVSQIVDTPEQLPQGVVFKIIRTNVKKQERSKRDNFLQTWSGKNLVANHSLDEYGQWEIYGEDPNCDFGGYHSNPYLDTVEGSLDAVINFAVELNNFWQWGAGGEIKKVQPKEIKVLK